MQSDPLDPEVLTELAVQGEDARVRQLCDPASVAEYEDLTAFIVACREAASVELEDDSLAERALCAANSEDLSWRGDLRLYGGFISDGLRSSALLRLAAASLLVHIAALPVVAFFALTDEPAVPEFRVEVGQRELPYSVNTPSELPVSPLGEDVAADGIDTLLVENTLRWSRWQLTKSGDPRDGSELESPLWLEQRAGVLWGGERHEPSGADYSSFVAAELALDAFLVSGGAFLSVEGTESSLRPLLRLVGDEAEPETWLALSSLARAESYGVLDETATQVLRGARNSMPLDHRFRGLIEVEGDLRRRLPLDPLWVQALSEFAPDVSSGHWAERLRRIGELDDR
jgi:hypothetical protein